MKPKYDYPASQRSMVKGSRVYEVGDENLPSVTSILDATSDKSAIFAWQKRVGKEEANKVKKEAAGLGTATHKLVENYLLEVEAKPNGNLVWQMAEKISKPLITNLQDNVRSDILGSRIFFINKINKNTKFKILHITNFNARHNGRLHYNTGRRINNGFIRSGHNVLI